MLCLHARFGQSAGTWYITASCTSSSRPHRHEALRLFFTQDSGLPAGTSGPRCCLCGSFLLLLYYWCTTALLLLYYCCTALLLLYYCFNTGHLRHDYSETVRLYIGLVAASADLPETLVARVCPHLSRQYLYFCTSVSIRTSVLVTRVCPHPRRQYLYFCTSKASELSTCPPGVLDQPVRHTALLAPPAFMSVCIRQHTSAYASIRHIRLHIRQHTSVRHSALLARPASMSVCIRQHTSAYPTSVTA
jgi:hypothetical protein